MTYEALSDNPSSITYEQLTAFRKNVAQKGFKLLSIINNLLVNI